MADPITGVEVDPDVVRTLDYLGRRSPVFSSGQSALPGVGGPTPSAGPAGPGGLGASAGSSEGAAPAAIAGTPQGPDSAATILNIVGQGIGGAKTATQTAKTLLEGGAPAVTGPDRLGPGVASSTGDIDPALVGALTRSGFIDSASAPAGIFKGVQPSGPVDTEGIPSGILDVAGVGLSGASLAALIAQLAESGKITPGQAVGLLQSAGGTASGAAGLVGPEVSPLLSTAGNILGGVGAAGSIGLSLADAFKAIHAADEDPRQYSTAGGVGAGLGLGALVGTAILPGYGTLIGAGAGGAAGDAIGQAIARNLPKTHYMALREHWGEVAADAVNNYGFGIQKAASNGGLPEIQGALSQRQADGHVGAYLQIPESIATAIGLPTQGPVTTTTFDSLTTPQFLMLLKAASQSIPEEWGGWVGASGDVQYLDQGRAQGVADAAKQTAMATMTALIEAYQPVLAQMPDVAPDVIAAGLAWGQGAPERQAAFLAQSGDYRGATIGSGE